MSPGRTRQELDATTAWLRDVAAVSGNGDRPRGSADGAGGAA
jgi:hypothetical protein